MPLASIVTLGIVGYMVPTLAGANAATSAPPVRARCCRARHARWRGPPQTWFGIAATRNGGGYWVVSDRGAVESFGDAVSHGDMSSTVLNKSVVGMAATPDGGGYWLDAADGGIFTFGDAAFRGSTGSLRLNAPVVGMAPTHDGGGYWMVASDGGIFAFGDAAFEGSMGGALPQQARRRHGPHPGWRRILDGRVRRRRSSPSGRGLRRLARATPPSSPIVYMAPTPDDNGYWLVSQDGTVYAFGDAGHYGSVQGRPLPPPRWRRPRGRLLGPDRRRRGLSLRRRARTMARPRPVRFRRPNVQATSPTAGSTSGSGNAGSSGSRGTSPAFDQGAQPFGWDGRRR